MQATFPSAFLALFTGMLIGAAAHAEDAPLRVGRISYLEGTVSFHAADQDSWSYATLNYPVVSGNAFWTEPDGRSEVQVGSVEIRMDHSTEMEATEIDEAATRLEVPQGTVNIHFATLPVNGSVEVITPAGAIELTQPGTYHIDSGQPTVNGASPQVQVTALEGQLEIRSPRAVLQVMTGETAVLTGNPPAFSLIEGNPTSFDDWALARERREEAHNAAQYVSPHVTGYEDLDYYGQWTPSSSYGPVWYPAAVQADWAPYRYGHWAFIAPWGWTWVDNAPWGFAPFHYGRWAYIDNRWGWVPGEIVPRPAYAPALVAFIGGAGWSVSLATGQTPAVGWVPLGPREVFHPYYPASPEYLRSVNISDVNRTQINNITVNNIRNVNVTSYVNQRGATVIPANAFAHGSPVHKAFLPEAAPQLAHAPITPVMTHVTPAMGAREEGQPMTALSHEPVAPPQVAAPKSPRAPQEPHIVHVEPSRPASVPQNSEARETDNRAFAHAPGPQFHHQPQVPAQQRPENMARPASVADIPHPRQQTRIAPTPQGWQRKPEPPHQSRPQERDKQEKEK